MTGPSIAELGPDEKRALLKRLLAERAATGVGEYALTHGQRALWFIQQLLPDTYAYNIALALGFRPTIDLTLLRRALDGLATRHAVLRTVFVAVEGQPRQRVLAPSPIHVAVFDMQDATDDEMYEALVAAHRQPFQLDASAFRVSLFRRGDHDRLLLSMHHIIVDASSIELILHDLHELYEAEYHGRRVDLATPAKRYSDFVAAESSMLESERGDALWEYWRRTLHGDLPVLALAGDTPPSDAVPLHGKSLPFELPASLTASIGAFGRSHGATLYTIVLVATQILLHRLGDQTDVIVGTPATLRTRSDFAAIVGYMVNAVAVRATVNADDTFLGVLASTRERVIDILQYQDYPFSLLVDRLQVRRDTGRTPIFQLLVNVIVPPRSGVLAQLFGSDQGKGLTFGSSSVVPYVLPQQEAQFELSIEVVDRDGRLSGNLRYQTSLYSDERAMEIRDAFIALLEEAIANPGARVADLSIPGRDQFEL